MKKKDKYFGVDFFWGNVQFISMILLWIFGLMLYLQVNNFGGMFLWLFCVGLTWFNFMNTYIMASKYHRSILKKEVLK